MKKESKLDPNRSKIETKMIREATCENIEKMQLNPTRILLSAGLGFIGKYIKNNKKVSENSLNIDTCFFHRVWPKKHPKSPPKWLQNRSKIDEKSYEKSHWISRRVGNEKKSEKWEKKNLSWHVNGKRVDIIKFRKLVPTNIPKKPKRS